MFDLLISGGEVIDGRGGPRRRADIGITGDRISAIGNLARGGGAQSAATIDATGLAVTRGSSMCTPISTLRCSGIQTCRRRRCTA